MARRLRRLMTPAERLLWAKLRNRRLIAKFRRQAIIRGWIVDFWCPSRRLVVEVDGPYHQWRATEDDRRDAVLTSIGIRTLRVLNREVEHALPVVLEKIRAALA